MILQPHQHDSVWRFSRSASETGVPSRGPEFVAATVNTMLYILSMVTVSQYFKLKTFARDPPLTKAVVVLLILVSSLQATFAFLCFYDFLSGPSDEEPGVFDRWMMIAPASFIAVYLTAFIAQMYTCIRTWQLTKVSPRIWLHRGIVGITLVAALLTLCAGIFYVAQIIIGKRRSLLYADANAVMRATVAIQSSTALVCETMSGSSLCFLMREKWRSLARGNPLKEFIDRVIQTTFYKAIAISIFTIVGALLFFVQPATYVFTTFFYAITHIYVVSTLWSLNAREAYGHLVSKSYRVAAPRTLEHQDDLVIAAGMHGMRFQDSVRHVSLVQSLARSWHADTSLPTLIPCNDQPQSGSSVIVDLTNPPCAEADDGHNSKPRSTKEIGA